MPSVHGYILILSYSQYSKPQKQHNPDNVQGRGPARKLKVNDHAESDRNNSSTLDSLEEDTQSTREQPTRHQVTDAKNALVETWLKEKYADDKTVKEIREGRTRQAEPIYVL